MSCTVRESACSFTGSIMSEEYSGGAGRVGMNDVQSFDDFHAWLLFEWLTVGEF